MNDFGNDIPLITQKLQSKTKIREKLQITLLYKKAASKMISKLTLAVNFTNILCAHFFIQNFGAKKFQSCVLGLKFCGAKM